MKNQQYYEEVAKYYDTDAQNYEDRYRANSILNLIRHDFRKTTESFFKNKTPQNILEIGCGPGIDVIYFSKRYPHATIYAIDVSPKMVELAQKNVKKHAIENAKISVDTLSTFLSKAYTENLQFDLIFSYFGALNTEVNLTSIANHLAVLSKKKSITVLTFVNRWYLMDVILHALLLNPQKTLLRLKNHWRGYSPTKKLNSYTRSFREIRKIFSKKFKIVLTKGYSIIFPPWYSNIGNKIAQSSLGRFLWHTDQFLNHSFFKYCGEYSLYAMKPTCR